MTSSPTAPRPMTAADPLETIQVVAAVRRRDGKFWVCRRTDDGGHGGLAGMWEYPGGKVEPGETLEAALRREMHEEFGVEVHVKAMIDAITTEGFGKRYNVSFFDVDFLGAPFLRVHDLALWYTVEELAQSHHLPSGTEFNRRLAAYSALRAAGEGFTDAEIDAARGFLDYGATRGCRAPDGQGVGPLSEHLNAMYRVCEKVAAAPSPASTGVSNG